MSAFENASKFVQACDGNLGWEGCKDYVVDGALFVAQAEALAEIKTVEAYCDWLVGLDKGPLKGNSCTLHSSSYDEANRTAVFFSTFTATHTGEGGPVEPTGKQTNSDYVYALTMNADGKVEKMCKVWNAPWCLKELGWM
ncbi:MAG: hypothetical protein JKY65_16055 [Planctomycetes bacterium]|nr:hypothetical protein [Planctomycetota bacterium]